VSTQKSGPALPLIIESLAPRLILGIEGNVLALTAGLKDRFTGISELGPPGPRWITLPVPFYFVQDAWGPPYTWMSTCPAPCVCSRL
jgi:hypothetical protein